MLSQKSLAQFNVDDEQLSRSLDNVASALNPVLETPLLDGVLVGPLVVPASLLLTVPHGLGRPARGFFVANATAAYGVPFAVPGAAAQPSPNGAIVLTFPSGAGASLTFWVF